MKKEINLYLIRHGQTQWNILDRMQGSQNSPLTEEGVQGAITTGKFLANVPFVAAYSSPQQRAMETRDYILAQHPNHDAIPRFEHPGLCEMDFGTWEGVPVAELRAIEEFNTYINNPAEYVAATNQGECYQTVLARMQQALEDIVQQQPSGNVLVVSHGSALRLLLHVLAGGNWHQHRDENYCARVLNTSVSIVNYQQSDDAPGYFKVTQYNDVSHL